MRVLGVDWSGAADPGAQRRGIWVAEAVDGELLALSSGRTRLETVVHLLRSLHADPGTVVAMDFSFGFPAWWTSQCGADDGPCGWELAATQGERWLQACDPPFWGRPGRPRPELLPGQSPWRRTETELRRAGLFPKSTFQIGGAGSVGTGSIRGMVALRALRREGMTVWPFDPWAPGQPTVVEAYPRWCSGPVVKSRPAERLGSLVASWPLVGTGFRRLVEASEDAFDAAITALFLSSREGWETMAGDPDNIDLIEGRVWTPPFDRPRASGRARP
ncbi:MAG: hypothetical protein NVSMB16_14430 [Acidimicrobiales bacterium]